ncbi:hypothetical protein P167DRAFT_533958 [Morchella conica CCBAS932]|uniref:Secreted protein n=1 Tax=Morchella conica CCBAS932 TaxID=1392247 RepID=A0A3N4KVH1_9PEZI|nr:hypothetical protein P167DRAFT_533958 [Morchella conica CCBAS932]
MLHCESFTIRGGSGLLVVVMLIHTCNVCRSSHRTVDTRQFGEVCTFPIPSYTVKLPWNRVKPLENTDSGR